MHWSGGEDADLTAGRRDNAQTQDGKVPLRGSPESNLTHFISAIT